MASSHADTVDFDTSFPSFASSSFDSLAEAGAAGGASAKRPGRPPMVLVATVLRIEPSASVAVAGARGTSELVLAELRHCVSSCPKALRRAAA